MYTHKTQGDYHLSQLLLELTQAKADGSYHKRLAKVRLLIIDDWRLEPLKPARRNDLVENAGNHTVLRECGVAMVPGFHLSALVWCYDTVEYRLHGEC